MPFLGLFRRGKKRQQEERITPVVLDLVLASSEAQIDAIIEEHRDELMSEAADRVFDRLLKESSDDPNLGQLIRQRRALLARHRRGTVGARPTRQPPTAPAPDIPPELLAQALQATTEQEFNRLMDQHPELLPVLQDIIQKSQQPGRSEALADRLTEFLQLETRSEEIAYLKSHPELLGYEVAVLLEQMLLNAQEEGEDSLYSFYLMYRDLLARCRREGIDAAYAYELREDELEERLGELNQLIQREPDNLQRRMELTRQVIPLLDRDSQPQLWASLRTDMAVMLMRPILANPAIARTEKGRAEDIEEAIGYFRESTAIFTREAFPERWAEIQNDLAAAYLHRIRGERAGNLEQAIQYLQRALEVYNRAAFPREWARTRYNLGRVFWERMRGERAENIEQAIKHFELALQVRTPQADPESWASTHNNLGLALWERIRGERAENIEQAIKHYRLALEVRTREAFPKEWAAIRGNLGLAYSDRIRGDQAENIERAIAYYQRALEVRTREVLPEEWARTQNNLGSAYLDRIRGESAENIEQAITHFQRAFEVRTREALPEDWAATQHNLGMAYSDRILGEPADNIEQAIKRYRLALEVYTRRAFPEDWARLQNSLGSAYSNRIRGERADNIEQAIKHYQLASEVFTRDTFPEQWAMIQHNLGDAYSDRIRGKRADNIEQAIARFQSALDVYTRQAFPDKHRRTQFKLGMLYLEAHRWAEAHAAYAAALAASELLYQVGATPQSRQAELGQTSEIAVRAAYCLAQLERLTQAVELLERSKARALGEVLARNEALLEAASLADQAAFAAARERIAALEGEARAIGRPGARDFLAISADLWQARQELDAIVARIHKSVPDFMPGGLDFEEIASVARSLGRPLVYLLTTDPGSLALVIPPGEKTLTHEHVIWLNDFKTDDLDSILFEEEDPQPRYLESIAEAGNVDALMRVLDEMWPILYRRLMAPVAARLDGLGYEQAVLIPSDVLRILPLPALTLEMVELTYAPSARVLQSALRAVRERSNLSPVLLGIGNPLPNPQPLAFARVEVEEIEPLFPARGRRVLYGHQATRSTTLRALAGATHLHFACHGAFDVDEPLDSALFLSGHDTLTLRDLLDGGLDLSASRLAVLSACQTGITDFFNVPDEAVGFPAGFLQAGVPGVVSTLWPVADISTALLLTRCYRHHLQDGLDPATALHQAQGWLREATAAELGLADYYARQYQASSKRDREALMSMRYYRARPEVKPFVHPYYWAAFVFSGVGV